MPLPIVDIVNIPVILFMLVTVFLLGLLIGYMMGSIIERYNAMKDAYRNAVNFKVGKAYNHDAVAIRPNRPSPSQSTETGSAQPKDIKPRQKPTQSRVMKYPKPQEIRQRREQEAMQEQLRSLEEVERESGTYVL